MTAMVIASVVVDGVRTSLRIADGRIVATGDDVRAAPGDTVVDGDGGALVPGLHDHHIHLAAIAATDRSVPVAGPDLDATLRDEHTRRPAGTWIRAVGYDETASGPLDRSRLDAVAPGRPIRVQHRSGAMWVLSSAALAALAVPADLAGVERDEHGEPTGRLFRLDDWLHDHLPAEAPPDVARVTRRLASYGVTGVTDATASTSATALELLALHGIRVHVTAMGGPSLAAARFPEPVTRGPVKIVLRDDDLPGTEEVARQIEQARRADRPVAVHCVTRAALALALASFDETGAAPGDRIEHGAVVPPELRASVADHRLTIVTQPAFVAAHGDRYLAEVDADDAPHLYPCASLLAAGIDVGGSTDAPFGPEDPWCAIRAAVERRTASGALVGPDEGVTAARALALFLSAPERPGGPPRRVERGAPADLCLLDAPLDVVLADPRASHVRAVICGGSVSYDRDGVTATPA